jgi:hypothetical protein
MSLQEKYDSVRALIEQHNAILGSPDHHINTDSFIICCKLAGGTTEERLKALSYEDILQHLPVMVHMSNSIKPIGLAKDIARVFRGKDEHLSTNEARPVSAKKADKMTLKELVEAYDPEEAENPVGKRLKEISKGEKFIVFASGRTLDVETTVKLLQEIKQGYPGRQNIEVNGEIKEVHPVGILPDNFVDENPLYRNRPLRPDGTCDQTNRSWNGIPMNVRQLIRVAMDNNFLKDISIERVHDIMDIVMGDKAFEKLAKRYPGAVVEFKKLESLGQLPVLKLVLKKGAGGTDRPFDKGKKVEFTKAIDKALEKSALAKYEATFTGSRSLYQVYYADWDKK